MFKSIPGPAGYPVVGNLFDVWDDVPINGLRNLAEKFGPIYRISTLGKETVVISSVKLLEELSDEKRFHKVVGAGLERVGDDGPHGLFRSKSEADPDWGQAHRVLSPAFGPLSITNLFNEMHDIATQLILKWARMGPNFRIPVTEDFTRLTLDTIALCAMNYRFNSFYQDEMHPFVKAMVDTLAAGQGPSTVLGLVEKLTLGKDKQKLLEDRALMRSVAKEIVQRRRENPSEKKDLLNAMVNGKDPKTGQKMRDELITANMINFLIAGHETTSGLLSFAIYYLLKSPSAYRAAQAEVDLIVGQGQITVDHLKEFKYLNAILRETLRLSPTAPAFMRALRPDNEESYPSLGGYAINHQTRILALLPQIHRDPDVYGEDSEEFKPERMLDEHFKKLPKSAWMPFGTGIRACIGRPFAWQEALLMLALVLQIFDMVLDDPSYALQIKQTLTIKPKDLYMRASLRNGMDATVAQRVMMANPSSATVEQSRADQQAVNTDDKSKAIPPTQEILVLYGSNTGTCQTLAQRLAGDGQRYGYKAEVKDMDSGIEPVQRQKPTIVITASYEGEPPDNAARFVHWLCKGETKLKSLRYAVFGCGHSDWASTFQKIPTLVDTSLEEAGAKRIVSRGVADAATGDIFSDFDRWTETQLWPALNGDKDGHVKDRPPGIDLEIYKDNRVTQLGQNVDEGKVDDTRRLTAEGEPEKRHLGVLLPSGMSYQPGDYLTVLPLNPSVNVERVMRRYSIPRDSSVVIKSSGGLTNLPTGTPLGVGTLLGGYIELVQPATKKVTLLDCERGSANLRKDLQTLLDLTKDRETISVLESLRDRNFESSVLKDRLSILDIIEDHPLIDLPFAEFLSLLPPMRARYYSISSSPLADHARCTITYSVTDTASLSGHGRFLGVCSSYLRSLSRGDSIRVAVKPANKQFHLPLQLSRTPILMFCAGTGLAPFRSFVQHRAQILAKGSESLAPAILYVGSRFSSRDRLYAEDLEAWDRTGAISVKPAFSHEPDHPDADGCAHVQDRMYNDREEIRDLWDQGAKIFVCGSPELARAISSMGQRIVKEKLRDQGRTNIDEEALQSWFSKQRGERFTTDVFS